MTTTLSTRSEKRPSKARDEDLGEQAWRERLGKCADDVDGYQDALDDSIETRDELIVKAIDLGWTRGQVSRWARVSATRVTQILARPPAE